MSNRLTIIIAIILLFIMFILAVTSMKDDSAIMDEVAHLPAGYSYLTQKDYRLNPEHPPLIKDLAAIPLVVMSALSGSASGGKINFPGQIKAWTQEINSQWDFGFNFLYNSGNDADKMLFWGRLPVLLLAILLGFFVFKWTRQLYGNIAAILALFLYSLSPTILAHSRFVTTDIAAAFGFFTAIYFFVQWLKNPSIKNLIMAGLFFGIAQLMKFSAFLLIPLFVFLVCAWICMKSTKGPTEVRLRSPKSHFGVLKPLFGLLLIFIIGLLVIYPIYQYHVWNYPIELQQRDIKFILASSPWHGWTNILVWTADKPILRAYTQYFFGLTMVLQRATGGNTTFFLGEVSNMGWKSYFPIVYIIKEPLAIHILTIIALLYLVWNIQIITQRGTNGVSWLQNHFAEFSMLSFIGLYWLSSITSNLNIGIRHVLPTFPFIYLLISGQITKILRTVYEANPRKIFYEGSLATCLVILLIWYAFASFSIYPHYLAYFNELVGGAKNGYLYVVDSNLDWGQDLKRLAKWADQNKIEKIKVDYFGGGTPNYYLKDKSLELHGDYGPQKGWLAVSATFYQTSKINPQTSYTWLDAYEPIAKIGYSIFVYNIK